MDSLGVSIRGHEKLGFAHGADQTVAPLLSDEFSQALVITRPVIKMVRDEVIQALVTPQPVQKAGPWKLSSSDC